VRAPELLHLLRFRLGYFCLAFALWLLVSCVPLAAGVAARAVFDALSGQAPAGANVWTLVALLALVELGTQPLEVAWIYAHLSFERALMLLVRTNLFHGLLTSRGRPPGARDGVGSADGVGGVGDAVNRFRDDVDGAITPINEWYRLAGEGLFALAAIVIMARVDAWITLVTVLPMGVVVVLINGARARLEVYARATREAAGRVSAFLGEALGAVLAVQVASAEPRVVDRLDALGDQRRRAALRSGVLDDLLTSASANVSFVARGIVLLLASQSLSAGTFTVGDFTLFALYMDWVFELPRRVGRLLASHRVAAVATERLEELSGGAPFRALVEHRAVDGTDAIPWAGVLGTSAGDRLERLEVRGLTYRHPTSGRGVHGVSFSLERGSLTVLTGPIAAGKSTLLRVLLGLLPLEAGEIRWNGRPVHDPEAFFVPSRAAYVPQVARLFSESLRDNILLGLPEDRVDLLGAVWRAALEADVAALERGLDTVVGVRGARLSGGQVQRAAAARALVREPELLVVDDLSSALDVETERALWSRLTEGSRTILAVSHRPETLRRADQILVLRDGRLSAGAAHEWRP
jgi:ATP-binding cassette subfamily B protein